MEKIVENDTHRLEERFDRLAELENKDSSLNDEEKIQLDSLRIAISNIESLADHQQLMLKQSKEVLSSYLEEDWPSFYEYWIYQNRLWNGEIKIKNVHYQSSISSFTSKASIAEKELLTKRNLKAILPSEYLYTFYDDAYFPNPLDRLEQQRNTQKLDNTALFYLYIFFNSYSYLFLLGILVFLFGAGFTSEKGKKSTLNLLETQPLSRYKIYLGKYGISIMLTLTITVGCILFMTVLGTIGDRFGDWAYPILHYDTPDMIDLTNYTGIIAQEGGFHFIDMGKYLLETILLFMSVLLFLISCSIFVSLIFNNMISSLALTLFLTIGGYFASIHLQAGSFAHLSPFTYINVGKIANGEIATILNNSSIQIWTGVSVLLVSSVISLLFGIVWYQKKKRIR
nr:ABC transporter permease subunit [Paenibacillus bovis]